MSDMGMVIDDGFYITGQLVILSALPEPDCSFKAGGITIVSSSTGTLVPTAE
jgi:hypothetical protein